MTKLELNVQLQTGDILHCSRNTLLSKIIKWFTKSNYSHTAVVIECWGELFVVDAQSDGVNPRKLDLWLKKYKYDVVVAQKASRIMCKKSYALKAFSKVGVTGYSYASLIFIHPWKIITGKPIKTDPEQGKMICSEYVAFLEGKKHPYKYTPQDMYEYTKKNKFKHRRLIYK